MKPSKKYFTIEKWNIDEKNVNKKMKPPKKLYVAEFRLYTKRHQQTEQTDPRHFIALYKMAYFVLVFI